MASSFRAIEIASPVYDLLSYLPVSSTEEYRKGATIYGPDRPSGNIYLAVEGTVKLSHITEGGHEVLLDIICPDELFGLASFLAVPLRSEQATAMGPVHLMVWPVATIEDLVTKRPPLAVALLQIMAKRNVDFAHRIESFSVDTVERRLARTLLHLSERLGKPDGNGSVRLMPLTHETLSRLIGTSREVVTQYMNALRRRGCVHYSRRETILYPDALAASLVRPQRAAAAVLGL